jgi:hypothetical protein
MKPLFSTANVDIHLPFVELLVVAARDSYDPNCEVHRAESCLVLTNALLDAATLGGFKQREICETVLACGPWDKAIKFSQIACSFITPATLRNACAQAGIILTADGT